MFQNWNLSNIQLKERYNRRKQQQQQSQTSETSFFLSRVRPNVDTNNIRTFLLSIGVDILNIEKVSHNQAKFGSFKICVQRKDFHKVSNEQIWSVSGAICRPWIERGNSNNTQYYNHNNVNNISVNRGNYAEWDGASVYTNNYGR